MKKEKSKKNKFVLIRTNLRVNFLLFILIISFFSCKNESVSIDKHIFSSFKEIPGITIEEITAIENLQKQNKEFIFSVPYSTESFLDSNNEIQGFAPFLSDWIYDFFQLKFKIQLNDIGDILTKLETGEIDLSLLTNSEKRRKQFILSYPITHRNIIIMQLEDTPLPQEIVQTRKVRFVFINNSSSMEAISSFEKDSYEILLANNYESVYNMLKTGEADAFIAYNTEEAAFDLFENIRTRDFFPLTGDAFSLATANSDLIPFISVFSKALSSPIYNHIFNLYKKGYSEYKRNKLFLRLTEEERDYIKNNPLIPVGVQYMSYPINFFNTNSGNWEGITIDIKEEISKLTGIKFLIANDTNAQTSDLIELMDKGIIYFIPYMVVSDDRIDRFLWSESRIFLFDRYVLLSKQNFPNVDINDIPFQRIGLPARTAFANIFKQWFPSALYVTEFDTTDEVFLAMDRGEIDLTLNSQSRLTALTNYYELSDYKANYLFDEPFLAYAVYSKEHAILRSIIDKTLHHINTDRIIEQWLTRTYNMETKKLRAQRPYLIGGIIFSLTVLSFALFTLNYINKKRKIIFNQKNELAILLEKTKRIADYELMRHILTIGAMKIVLWDMDIPLNEPIMPSTEIIYSKEFRKYFGYEDENDFPNVLGSWIDCIHPEDRDYTLYAFLAHIYDKDGKTPYNIEYRFKRKDGEYRNIRDIGETYRGNEGEPIRIAGSKQDITDLTRHKMGEENAKAASEAKSKFLATMSHEIRTPINVIMGVTDSQLMNDDIPQNFKEAFEKINESGNLLLSIINDILDLSKIEAKKFELIPVEYEIFNLIRDSANMWNIRYGDKQIKFKLLIKENIPNHLYGDDLRIKQILNNLLSNAFKYTDMGEVELSFEAEWITEPDKVKIIICVRDTGQGMTQDQINKLLVEEYTRFNMDVNRTTMGTGLGIAITRNLIKMMEGELIIESEIGEGSVFTVKIPQDVVRPELLGRETADNLQNFNFTQNKRKQKVKIQRRPMPYGKVLVVDDMQSNLDVAMLLLKPYQLQIETATGGYDALLKVKDGKEYDIIFMDHMMPDIDGITATKVLRAGGYEKPVVALTANAIAGQEDVFKANGFDEYISKPIDIRKLNDVLNKYIRDEHDE